MKSFAKEVIENSNLKLIKNERNNKNDNYLLNPKNNYMNNTYKKKLIQKSFTKIDNNYFDNNTFKANGPKIFDNSKNNNRIDSQLMLFNSINYFSPKNESNLNNLSIFTSLNNKLINEKENINPNNLSSNKIKQRIYIKNLSDKDETKYQTDKKLISYNNNSDSNSNSFNIQKKKNSIINQKLTSSIKLRHKLKNIITKIDFKNENNSKINKKIKNIILCEYDEDGKVIYKIKEMKKSAEKIIMEKENSRKNKQINVTSPKNNKEDHISLYVKKNQGTILRKSKNVSKFDFILK